MGKKNSNGVKDTNTVKMVPESEAFEALKDLQMKTIMGNRKSRRMFLNWIEGAKHDKEMFSLNVDLLLTLVIHDIKVRKDFVEKFSDDEESMEIYRLAIDIRETLGYDIYDNTTDETESVATSRN